jgi:uncharacterized protein YecT (DUF1311 family)
VGQEPSHPLIFRSTGPKMKFLGPHAVVFRLGCTLLLCNCKGAARTSNADLGTRSAPSTSANAPGGPSGSTIGDSIDVGLPPSSTLSRTTDAGASAANAPANLTDPLAAVSVEAPKASTGGLGRRIQFPENPCEGAKPGESAECWYGAAEDMQDELNHRVVLARRNPDGSDATVAGLVEAQKKWQAKRDADCNVWDKKYPGGSLANLSIAMCRYEAGRKRLTQLRAEGD